MPPTLIVTVDTEEEFDWSTTGRVEQWSTNHVCELPWFQELCECYGVRPTYVVDYPIATSEQAVEILGDFLNRGACEIGAHPHPWVNPPLREQPGLRNTYLCNLPLDLQQEKVAELTNAIRTAFGIQPTSFKAGRYGIDFRLAPYLRELGYTVDTSIMPFCSFTDDGGPDFRNNGPAPFWIPSEHGNVDDSNGMLLEIPCTAGFNRHPFPLWNRVHQTLAHERFRRLHPVGVLYRLKILRKIVLSPEVENLANNLKLMRVMANDPHAVLNVTLHSPSVQAGHTPFVQTEDDLKRFRHDLRRIFETAVEELDTRCLTLSEFCNDLKQRTKGSK